MKIVLTTLPDLQSAEKLSQVLIEQKLAACAHIYNSVQSIYEWQGQIERSQEIPVSIKTHEGCIQAIEAVFKRIHPYELPQFIILEAQASTDYEQWLANSCRPQLNC